MRDCVWPKRSKELKWGKSNNQHYWKVNLRFKLPKYTFTLLIIDFNSLWNGHLLFMKTWTSNLTQQQCTQKYIIGNSTFWYFLDKRFFPSFEFGDLKNSLIFHIYLAYYFVKKYLKFPNPVFCIKLYYHVPYG